MHKNYTRHTLGFSFVVYLLACLILPAIIESPSTFAKTKKSTLKSRRHSHAAKHKRTKEEDLATKEAAAAAAQEARLNEGRNLILAKAYRLYDNGTSEYLQGNYKYSILQLKLADELLQEHGQANSSLSMATLMGLASSAQAAKDYPLAKSTYERLLTMHPQDTQILLKLAKLEAIQSNFRAAQADINKVRDLDSGNAEAHELANLISSKIKSVKNGVLMNNAKKIKEGKTLP